MLKTIYTIAEKVKGKDIYIYGINRDSITVFTNLVLWGGNICGFLDDIEERFIGKCFMNRPIVSSEQIGNTPNALIVVSEIVGKSAVKERVGERIEVFYCDEMIALNEELRDVEVYLYGMGSQGEKIYKQCCKSGIRINAVCVSKKSNVTVWNGLPVYEADAVDREKNCAFIIATVQADYRKQMLESLQHHAGDKYVLNYMMQHHISNGRFFQIVGKAAAEHKKIWLYGKNRDLKEKVSGIFLQYAIEIQGELNSLYDLAYDSIDDVVVVIADNDESEVERACDILDSIGFALEDWNYTSLANEVFQVKEKVKTPNDLLLGWSHTSDEVRYPGFFVHGDDCKQDIRIMVLGGSTSTDGIFRAKSWVRFFYERLVKENYSVTIYNGAASGHGSTKELLHLLRDGAYLNLDYVITLSGVNDTVSHGAKNFFSDDFSSEDRAIPSGLESLESRYEFWYRNMKVMKGVAELFGAEFFSFLQPMAIAEKMNLFQVGMHEVREFRKEMLEFRRRVLLEKDKICINMLDFLDKGSDMYIDICHYSEKGNQLIADMIFETIRKQEGKLRKV